MVDSFWHWNGAFGEDFLYFKAVSLEAFSFFKKKKFSEAHLFEKEKQGEGGMAWLCLGGPSAHNSGILKGGWI